MTDGYNGWKNHQTWADVLHFGSDQGVYEFTCEWAADSIITAAEHGPYESHGDFRAAATRHHAEVLETLCDEALNDEPPHWAAGWAKDMIADAKTLDGVDWFGIADGHIDEALDNWSDA
jgi:hypothetical protein